MLARRDTRTRDLVRPFFHVPARQIAAAVAFAAILVALLAVAWWVYHPGLSGDFLFDDFANLPTLGATGPVGNWTSFLRYVTSGDADPTGRPLTLLTFLIDARNWPANPYPFKVTNVILHLINGALLVWVLWKLGTFLLASPSGSAWHEGARKTIPAPSGRGGAKRTRAKRERAAPGEGPGSRNIRSYASFAPSPLPLSRGERGSKSSSLPEGEGTRSGLFALDNPAIAIAALFGAGAWLLHPLFVSTTLYIVQREAMLPATFVLIGMLGWMASRQALAAGHIKRALVGMALSAWLCTLLAVLSKANGALFPILLLLTEWIVLSRHAMATACIRRWHKRAMRIFLIIPSALVIGYLLYLLPSVIANTPAIRGWTVGERLLTEPRVVTDYLRLLFIPHAHSTGLFNDQFSVSTSWIHPAATLPCAVLILALIGAGFALRKKYPAIALALLFYFAAQLMESGWLSLELYFEHRNYLPAMLLFWPIGLWMAKPGSLRFMRVGAAALILATLATLTVQRSKLWGDGFRQAQVWAAINPDSARAQTNAALYDMNHNRPRLAAARLRLSLPRHPDDIQAPINLIGAECKLGAVQPRTLARADFALTRTRVGGQTAFKWFSEALDMATRHACPGLDFAALQGTLDAARHNSHWQNQMGLQQDLQHLQGELDLAEGNPDAALKSFNRALAMRPSQDAALEQAAYLGAQGYPQLGLDHLNYFNTLPPGPKPGFGMPRIHAWVLREQGWWAKETAYLRNNLEEDAAAKLRQPAKVTPPAGAVRFDHPSRSTSR